MKPINIRIIALLSVVLTFITAFFLIHELRKQQDVETAEPLVPANKVHLTFAYNGGIPKTRLAEIIENYNRTNPDKTTVELIDTPKEDYARLMNMHMIDGDGPDLLSVDEDWKTTYFLKNWLADLTAAAKSPELPAYDQWAIDYGSFNSQIFSVPHAFGTTRLIYNKSLFVTAGLDPEVPPATLDELAKNARQISQSQLGYQRYGFAWPLGDKEAGFINSMEVPLTYSGLAIFNPDTGRYDLTGYGKWLDAMNGLEKTESLLPGGLSLGYQSALAQFAKGNVGMMIVTNSDVYELEHSLDVQFDWGAALPPVLDAKQKDKYPLILKPEPLIAVNNASEHKEAAIRFWTYLESSETLQKLYETNLLLPYSAEIRKASQPNSTAVSHIRSFLPTESEAFYPPAPVLLNNKLNPNQSLFLDIDWSNRLQAYSEAVSGRFTVAKALQLETDRMNLLLQEEVQDGHIQLSSFLRPVFHSPFGN
ncbi:ABC transporter substrate-binding protein [Paenibacillus glycanilyticus]|uniref:ABC transporter substrate-binding protein n=1 Tax=Paenibacillus glycanilyticus TaxID=126569 RepID=A0ABQ6G7M0_9BACL|nr:ABC transporter substrate-binding protein [Paenibacillus glycanilyticus]GLX66949.1 hypothetical protein MU1_12930 [Paenibacillus glycanilyticus]